MIFFNFFLVRNQESLRFCQTPDLGQDLEFDFTFAMEQEQ